LELQNDFATDSTCENGIRLERRESCYQSHERPSRDHHSSSYAGPVFSIKASRLKNVRANALFHSEDEALAMLLEGRNESRVRLGMPDDYLTLFGMALMEGFEHGKDGSVMIA
jgi:hypothetical protein